MLYLLASSVYLIFVSVSVIAGKRIQVTRLQMTQLLLFFVVPPLSWYWATLRLLSGGTEKETVFVRFLCAGITVLLCSCFVGWMGSFSTAWQALGFINLTVTWFIVPVSCLIGRMRSSE